MWHGAHEAPATATILQRRPLRRGTAWPHLSKHVQLPTDRTCMCARAHMLLHAARVSTAKTAPPSAAPGLLRTLRGVPPSVGVGPGVPASEAAWEAGRGSFSKGGSPSARTATSERRPDTTSDASQMDCGGARKNAFHDAHTCLVRSCGAMSLWLR
jgi:hypothetical protein